MFKRSQIPFHHQQIFHITDEMYQKKARSDRHEQTPLDIKKYSEIANTERRRHQKVRCIIKRPLETHASFEITRLLAGRQKKQASERMQFYSQLFLISKVHSNCKCVFWSSSMNLLRAS